MDLPLVYAITLNWNRVGDTLECLESLVTQTYPNLKILVVDNASTDGSPQKIKERYPHIEQVVNSSNLGFAAGFNVGLRRALNGEAELAFIVNNDTILAPNTIELLVQAVQQENVGITAPIIYFASRPDHIQSAGAGRSPVTLELTGNHGRGRTYSQIVEREFVSGCAMMIKRPVLEQVGLFDEDYVLYYEDSDYCLRVRQASFRLLVIPQARIWHKVSLSSGGSDSPNHRYWMGRSGVLFFRKHIRGWRWLIIIPWRLGSMIKTTLRLSIDRNFLAIRSFWRGVWDGLSS